MVKHSVYGSNQVYKFDSNQMVDTCEERKEEKGIQQEIKHLKSLLGGMGDPIKKDESQCKIL